ncbi:MAG TPA: AAA family ATPase [Moraxellaceae bacterium]|nr:AAA family ATPase [Moraxellaceae bacterium]
MKILLLSAEPAHLEELRTALADKPEHHEITGGPLALLGNGAELVKEGPELVLVEVKGTEHGIWQQLEHLSQLAPQLVIAVISDNQTADFLRTAMRAGAREVLVPGSGELVRFVTRVEQQMQRSRAHEKGRVLAFLPTKGSSGATFLACTLGYALSNSLNRKVLLIDLNLQVGDAAFYVSDKQPTFTLADVSEQIHRLDSSFLAASAMQVHPNFSILASPNDPEKAMLVKAEHVGQILKAAVQHYDFVILDVDRSLDAVSIAALDNADLIFPVLQQSLPFLRDAARLQKIFSSLGYGADRIRPILNRFNKGEEVAVEDIEKSLGIKVYRKVPNSYHSVVSAVNQGVPLAVLESAGHPVVQAVNEMAGELTGARASQESWVKRLLHH